MLESSLHELENSSKKNPRQFREAALLVGMCRRYLHLVRKYSICFFHRIRYIWDHEKKRKKKMEGYRKRVGKKMEKGKRKKSLLPSNSLPLHNLTNRYKYIIRTYSIQKKHSSFIQLRMRVVLCGCFCCFGRRDNFLVGFRSLFLFFFFFLVILITKKKKLYYK